MAWSLATAASLATVALLVLATVPITGQVGGADGETGVPPASVWLTAAETGEPLELTLDGRTLTLELAVDTELMQAADLGPGLVALRGHAADVEGSLLAAAAQGATLDGVLHIPGHPATTIAPTEDGALVARPGPAPGTGGPIEPIDSMELFDQSKDDFGCLHPTPTPMASPASILGGWQERTFDVAFTVDEAFVDEHGEQWKIRALGLASTLDALYDRYIDLDVRVADLHVHDFEGTNTGALLSSMRNHYREAHPDLARENTHLFTGKALQGDAVGQATCIGGAGDPDKAFTVSQATECGAGNLIVASTTSNRCVKIAAHELGHILSAHHHYSNCAESLLVHEPTEPMSACTLMINAVNLATTEVSTFNRLVMRGWADQAGL